MSGVMSITLDKSYPPTLGERAAYEAYRGLYLANDPVGFGLAHRMLAATNMLHMLPKITVPTMVVAGKHDTVRPPAGTEELAKKIPTARLVSTFNTVPSEVLFGVYAAKRRANWPSLVYCGDDRHAKKVAVRLIRDVGFEPLDAGPLRIARYTEPFALLVAQLAYEGDRGPEVAYRFAWYS